MSLKRTLFLFVPILGCLLLVSLPDSETGIGAGLGVIRDHRIDSIVRFTAMDKRVLGVTGLDFH